MLMSVSLIPIYYLVYMFESTIRPDRMDVRDSLLPVMLITFVSETINKSSQIRIIHRQDYQLYRAK